MKKFSGFFRLVEAPVVGFVIFVRPDLRVCAVLPCFRVPDRHDSGLRDVWC